MAVTMKRLEHVNVRTANLDAMVEWYGRMLGMTSGPRPGFSFPGAWLYAGDHPIVHLVGREARPTPSVPDSVLNPRYDAVVAMMKPNTIVFSVAGM